MRRVPSKNGEPPRAVGVGPPEEKGHRMEEDAVQILPDAMEQGANERR